MTHIIVAAFIIIIITFQSLEEAVVVNVEFST